jgi:biopolymer transport protein ExbB/TolQ
MFLEEFEYGGPVMYAIFAVWVMMLTLILERVCFWTRRSMGRPLVAVGDARSDLAERVADQAERNLDRIDGLSHLATSLGLFGTVLGITGAFFSRSAELSLAAPEVLASGMATALFTTVAGLAVFLVGQGTLLVFQWWTDVAVRRIRGGH